MPAVGDPAHRCADGDRAEDQRERCDDAAPIEQRRHRERHQSGHDHRLDRMSGGIRIQCPGHRSVQRARPVDEDAQGHAGEQTETGRGGVGHRQGTAAHGRQTDQDDIHQDRRGGEGPIGEVGPERDRQSGEPVLDVGVESLDHVRGRAEDEREQRRRGRGGHEARAETPTGAPQPLVTVHRPGGQQRIGECPAPPGGRARIAGEDDRRDHAVVHRRARHRERDDQQPGDIGHPPGLLEEVGDRTDGHVQRSAQQRDRDQQIHRPRAQTAARGRIRGAGAHGEAGDGVPVDARALGP